MRNKINSIRIESEKEMSNLLKLLNFIESNVMFSIVSLYDTKHEGKKYTNIIYKKWGIGCEFHSYNINIDKRSKRLQDFVCQFIQ